MSERDETERRLDRLIGRDPEQCEAVSTDGYRCELLAGHYDYHQERTCSPLGAARHWGTLGFEDAR